MNATEQIVGELLDKDEWTGKIYSDGLFFPATVLRDVRPEMTAFRNEIFGPVAAMGHLEGAGGAVPVLART